MHLNQKLINNVENLKIAPNEVLIPAPILPVFNRNYDKLLDNDKILNEYSKHVCNGTYRIMPWVKNQTYKKHDLVWYTRTYVSPELSAKCQAEIQKQTKIAFKGDESKELDLSVQEEISANFETTTLYLLRSLDNENKTEPSCIIVDLIPTFDASGWKNENIFGSIYTDYYDMFMKKVFDEQMSVLHESNPRYHKFGQLSCVDDIRKGVLLADLTNLKEDRRQYHFPSYTSALNTTTNIIGGTIRKWDCGLLEYNITFKLGDTPTGLARIQLDGSIDVSTKLNANTFNFNSSVEIIDPTLKADNRLYYLHNVDANIFTDFDNPNTIDTTYNNIDQRNLNNTVNVFTGYIKFPEPFIDTNYTIFGNTPSLVHVLNSGSEKLLPNVNNIVYTNKAPGCITAMLIVPTYEGNIRVLGKNRFQCQITGRWK